MRPGDAPRPWSFAAVFTAMARWSIGDLITSTLLILLVLPPAYRWFAPGDGAD